MSTKTIIAALTGVIFGASFTASMLYTRDLEEFCGETMNISVELDTESYTKGQVEITCREHKYISDIINVSHKYNPATAKIMSIMAVADENGMYGDGGGFSYEE